MEYPHPKLLKTQGRGIFQLTPRGKKCMVIDTEYLEQVEIPQGFLEEIKGLLTQILADISSLACESISPS